MEFASGRVPDTMGQCLVAATESCVAVGCLMDYEGPTTVVFARADELEPAETVVFDDVIDTPGKELSICSCHNERLLTATVGGTRTRVQIIC